MIIKGHLCQICEKESLRQFENFSELIRITSDCRPYKKGGTLTICEDCGAIQKINTPTWRVELEEIYGKYFAYHQSGGQEQKVFDSKLGSTHSRSEVIVDRLKTYLQLGKRCQLIDIGCGSGLTLTAFGKHFPEWVLNGFEIGDKHLLALKKIKNFDSLYSGDLEKINAHFDLVTMIHSLEHFVEPKKTLKEISKKISSKYLFIEVCNIEENPFDILVADHLMHFSPNSLENLIKTSGFSTVTVNTNWIHKEISMLCQVASPDVKSIQPDYKMQINPAKVYEKILAYVEWLKRLRKSAVDLIDHHGSIGIFGSSIGATWLASQLTSKISFFVDEDSSRVGRKHLNIPIISPQSVPNDSTVLIPLPPHIADAIFVRLNHEVGNYVLPPELNV